MLFGHQKPKCGPQLAQRGYYDNKRNDSAARFGDWNWLVGLLEQKVTGATA
jgi:hypothetical protein